MNNNEKLIRAFAEALNVHESSINDSLLYQGIPEWDSISHMILISQLEAEFDVSIETDDVIDMSSFSKAKDILIKYNIQF